MSCTEVQYTHSAEPSTNKHEVLNSDREHHHNVTTKLSYLDTNSPNWDSPIVVLKNPEDILKIESNHKKMIQTEVKIFDVGDRMYDYKLVEHAFQFVRYNTKLTDEDCLDDARIKEIYYPEVEKLIKDV